jgi:hypothetical protein
MQGTAKAILLEAAGCLWMGPLMGSDEGVSRKGHILFEFLKESEGTYPFLR